MRHPAQGKPNRSEEGRAQRAARHARAGRLQEVRNRELEAADDAFSDGDHEADVWADEHELA